MKEKKNYSVSAVRDTRSSLAGDPTLSPIKLLVDLNGQFRVALGLYSNKADFNSAMKPKGGTDDVKALRKKIAEHVQKAEEVLDSMPNPNKEKFLKLFRSTTFSLRTKGDITPVFEEYIAGKTEEGSIKYAYSLTLSLRSLKKYKKTICFEEIDTAWLKGYEKFMAAAGNSVTTTQIYTRNLRTVYNFAIKDGLVNKKFYPFDDYSIGSSAGSQKVLFQEDIALLTAYKGVKLRESRSKSYWLFCYMAGINFKDFCYMKQGNIDAESSMLNFVREKTKRTNKVAGKQVKIYLSDEMKQIIKEYGNNTDNPNDYLFPILNGRSGAADCEDRRDKIQRIVNDNLKAIGKKLGIKTPLVLNLARHSFASVLKRTGTSVAFISELLGHADVKTTNAYLHSLPNSDYKEASDKLLGKVLLP